MLKNTHSAWQIIQTESSPPPPLFFPPPFESKTTTLQNKGTCAPMAGDYNDVKLFEIPYFPFWHATLVAMTDFHTV